MHVFRTLAAANRYANRCFREQWSVSIERERSPIHSARFLYIVRCYAFAVADACDVLYVLQPRAYVPFRAMVQS